MRKSDLPSSHEPASYDCPFCRPPHLDDGWVFEQGSVFCLVPTHYWGVNRGNCLIIPRQHFENIYTIDPQVGADLLRVSQRVALAMKQAFDCDGVSTRQHNEPAGNQDVWHFHQHIFPRYHGDGLYAAAKLRYEPGEQAHYAARLRVALSIGESE